ncbi:helix-turn-helix domain-containing protein [Acidisphaera rubrifaciens]|nr:helix-turn-helix transcriptional regulator [Acidisphaera rubrifaciens]
MDDIDSAALSPGARVRDLRHARGMTQSELADAIGVSRSAVAQWESGRAGQATPHLRRVADVLGVSVDHLLGPEASGAAAVMTGDERALLALYRTAASPDRQLLLLIARRLAARDSASGGESDPQS